MRPFLRLLGCNSCCKEISNWTNYNFTDTTAELGTGQSLYSYLFIPFPNLQLTEAWAVLWVCKNQSPIL